MNTAYLEFDIAQWLQHIQNQHWRTIDLTLQRVSQVWSNLAGQCARFTIVVAGTNGKGSSVSMLDGVFRQAGKCTGSYTSPHLVRFNERINIDGKEASDGDICRAFVRIEQARDGIPLTYFEFGTLAALLIFEQHHVDIAILEVGMGGRLDAVNIVDSDLVLMTCIDVDHEKWLGSDRESIATEKAGVIKPGGMVVCSDPNIPDSVLAIAKQQNATLIGVGRDYSIEAISNKAMADARANTRENTQEKKSIEKTLENPATTNPVCWKSNHANIPQDWRCLSPLLPPFAGSHQITNLGGVVAALALTSGKTGVSTADLSPGLRRAKLFARCQVLERADDSPQVIVDVAHNWASASELARFLGEQACSGKTYAVIGVLADKILEQIVKPVMAHIDYWFLASLSGERGQTGAQLAAKLKQVGCSKSPEWEISENPVDAYLAAIKRAKAEDRVVIFGSFYTVGDIIDHLEQAK